jgi:hypothetical protein
LFYPSSVLLQGNHHQPQWVVMALGQEYQRLCVKNSFFHNGKGVDGLSYLSELDSKKTVFDTLKALAVTDVVT